MNRADYIEQIGTGINRIKNAIKNHGKGEVNFNYNNFFTVIFTRTKRIGNRIGKDLTKNQNLILKSMIDNAHVSDKELSKIAISHKEKSKKIFKS